MIHDPNAYLIVSAALLSLGVFGLLVRRNVIAMLISLELILSAANLNFVTFGRFSLKDAAAGQVFAIFVIALAAAEVCIALSIALLLVKNHRTVFVDEAKDLKG